VSHLTGKNWRGKKVGGLGIFNAQENNIEKIQKEGMWMRKKIERHCIDFLKSQD